MKFCRDAFVSGCPDTRRRQFARISLREKSHSGQRVVALGLCLNHVKADRYKVVIRRGRLKADNYVTEVSPVINIWTTIKSELVLYGYLNALIRSDRYLHNAPIDNIKDEALILRTRRLVCDVLSAARACNTPLGPETSSPAVGTIIFNTLYEIKDSYAEEIFKELILEQVSRLFFKKEHLYTRIDGTIASTYSDFLTASGRIEIASP